MTPVGIVLITLFVVLIVLSAFLLSRFETWRNKKIIQQREKEKQVRGQIKELIPEIYKHSQKNRIKIQGNSIFIDNTLFFKNVSSEFSGVMQFEQSKPVILVFENKKKSKTFTIEPIKENVDLKNQFLHFSVRVHANQGVQIDGYISKNQDNYDEKEGLRFQPFFLSDADVQNDKLRGAGMIERGFHFPGVITSTNVRMICVCDFCEKSFSLESFHSGFSEAVYFYSSNSKEFLIVPFNKIPELANLSKDTPAEIIENINSKLPKSNDGQFAYYNPLRCPNCDEIYINYLADKDRKRNDYYGHYYINTEPIYYN